MYVVFCCPIRPMISWIKLSILIQANFLVYTPHTHTHSKRETLDLVLISGFLLMNMNLIDFYVSDHKAIVYNVPLSPPTGLVPVFLMLILPVNSVKLQYHNFKLLKQQYLDALANSS